MPRSIRVYGKKRGNRRTGSRAVGSAGEALFFAVFLLLGCAGLAFILASLILPEWRANHEFVEHTCTVLDGRVGQSSDDEGGAIYRPEIQIEYEINGETYRIWTYDISQAHSSGRDEKQAVVNRFEVGKRYVCWFDPADPSTAVVVRGYSWWLWLVLIVPISFILIGGGGCIHAALHWGKSAERSAAITRRTSQLELFDRGTRKQADYPNIPTAADMLNSPGTTLAFRLPIGTSPAWALFAALLACLFWNGIVSVFLVIAVDSHLTGDPEWFLTIFLIPFVIVGLALVFYLIRQLLITTGIGPTLLEIADHPLHPAGQYRLFVSQSGRLSINSLEVSLVCQEKASYRQGTDTRTETREVYRQQVFLQEGFEIHRGMPFEAQCDVEVPGRAMHSFKSDHNEINWKLLVKGDVQGWPDFERAFPVIVHPNPNEK